MTEFQSTLWTVIRGARAKDDAAVRDFVAKYRAPIVAYCVRRGLASEAEDLAQEVFLRIFRDGVLEKADPSKGRFRSLLLAVARHAVGNHLERERAGKRGAGQVQSLAALDVASEERDETFDREWIRHLIFLALDRLARDHPNYHDGVRRFLLEGCSYADIAASLGRSEGDVKNYVFRGKEKLVEYLREQVREYSASRAEYEEELRYLSKFLSV